MYLKDFNKKKLVACCQSHTLPIDKFYFEERYIENETNKQTPNKQSTYRLGGQKLRMQDLHKLKL